MDRVFDVAVGHRPRLRAFSAGWRGLAGGEAVDLVVHDDIESREASGEDISECGHSLARSPTYRDCERLAHQNFSAPQSDCLQSLEGVHR